MKRFIFIFLCISLVFLGCSVSSRDSYFEGYFAGEKEGYATGYDVGYDAGYNDASGDYEDLLYDLRSTSDQINDESTPYDLDDMKDCYSEGFMEGVHTLILYLEEDYGMNYDRLIDRYFDPDLNPWNNFNY